MAIEDQLLARLKGAQLAHATASMQHPSSRDAFEYGMRVGVYAGYQAAIDLLLQLLKEERDGERDL